MITTKRPETKREFGFTIELNSTTGRTIAVYLQVCTGLVKETVSHTQNLITDHDIDGKLLGVELLGCPTKEELETALAREEPALKQFLCREFLTQPSFWAGLTKG